MSQPEQHNEPEYGQYQQPEYGAMRSKYGPDYNPYLYGAPEPDKPKSDSANGNVDAAAWATSPFAWPQGNQQAGGQGQSGWPGTGFGPGQPGGQQPGQQGQSGQFGQPNQSGWQPNGSQQAGPGYYPGGYPGMQGQPYPPQGQPGGGQGPQGNRPPRFYNGVNLDDPSQNPLYGHWDSYAIIAFVLALFFPVPVLSAFMGVVAMWRTRTFHMKGFGLAVAAVVINVLYTIAVIWMAMNGVDASTLYQEALQQLMGNGSGGSGSTGDSSLSA